MFSYVVAFFLSYSNPYLPNIVFVTDKTSLCGAPFTQLKHTFIKIPDGPLPNLVQMTSPPLCNAMSKAK